MCGLSERYGRKIAATESGGWVETLAKHLNLDDHAERTAA